MFKSLKNQLKLLYVLKYSSYKLKNNLRKFIEVRKTREKDYIYPNNSSP